MIDQWTDKQTVRQTKWSLCIVFSSKGQHKNRCVLLRFLDVIKAFYLFTSFHRLHTSYPLPAVHWVMSPENHINNVFLRIFLQFSVVYCITNLQLWCVGNKVDTKHQNDKTWVRTCNHWLLSHLTTLLFNIHPQILCKCNCWWTHWQQVWFIDTGHRLTCCLWAHRTTMRLDRASFLSRDFIASSASYIRIQTNRGCLVKLTQLFNTD